MTHEDAIFDSTIWHLRNSINNGKQNLFGGECERYFRELVEKLKGTITPTPDITAEVTDKNNCDIGCPDGYEFYDEKGNLIGTKVMMRPKTSKYPKTYAECCEVLVGRKPNPNEISFDRMELCLVDLDNTQNIDFQNPYLSQLNILFRLRMCRNAYWKIAGEKMGLGKSWDSTYGCGEWGYWIGYNINENKIYLQDSRILVNHILVFPTKEMRDAFYENFKELIESCKELL